MRARTAVVGFVMVALLVGSVSPAYAARVATGVVQQGETTTAAPDRVLSISGYLTSSKARCTRNRSITITDQAAATFGTAKSDSDGNWTVFGDGPRPGTYAISVKKKRVSRTLTCKSAFVFASIS